MSKSQPYFLRTAVKQNPINHPIYFSLIGLKCESLQGYEEGVDFIDSWHRYIDEPSDILNESTSNVEVSSRPTNSDAGDTTNTIASVTTPSPNQHRISTLPESEFSRLLGSVNDKDGFIEFITPEALTAKDTIQVVMMLALDPHLFNKKIKKGSTITRREQRNVHRIVEGQEEREVSISEGTSSSADDDEETLEVDLEVEEGPEARIENNAEGDDDDDEAIYILAENFRANQEGGAEENESNASTEPATSSEPES